MHDSETLKQVGALHVGNLDQSFLSSLGVDFLALMYQAIDECECSVLLVEAEGSGVTGFIAATESMTPIFRQMLRHWRRLVPALCPSLFSPLKVWRIFEILLYSRRSPEHGGQPSFELLSIAVTLERRGAGVAERVYRRLINHCRASGVPAFKIIVGESLFPAHQFYRRMGAEVAGEVYIHGGERSLVYVQATR